MIKIGKRLKHLRESAEYDIEQMAEAMGVKSYTIRRYENDDRTPDYDTLLWYAKTFCVTVDYILDFKVPILSSAKDIPIDYDHWIQPSPEELRDEYIVGAFFRIARQVTHLKQAHEALGKLTMAISDKRMEVDEEEDKEKNNDEEEE